MRKKTFWAAIALTMMAACTSDDEATTPSAPVVDPVEPLEEVEPLTLTRAQAAMVAGSNDFAFSLMREVADDGKSLVLSPISITYALGMLNNGATGQTQQQINRVLGFESADSVNEFCKQMLYAAPRLDLKTKVMIANNIYVNKNYTLKPAFVLAANDYYETQPETRDFSDGETMDVINRWASDHTEGMIERILTANEFNPEAVSYLLNAIYFKGLWTSEFDKGDTQYESFGDGLRIPMMRQSGHFGYAETDDCQLLRMDYGNGAYAMNVVLPREGKTVGELLRGMTAAQWATLSAQAVHQTVSVRMPRFETKTEQRLDDVMKKLGMTDAFSPDDARFTEFCDAPTFIGLMKQSARIKVDEAGAEAAAVTVIGMELTALEHEVVKTFHATRPFLYIISEQSTGAIFFIGQFVGS